MSARRNGNAILLATALGLCTLTLAPGCASTETQASLGENIDDSLITAKVKSTFVEDKTVDATNISVETFKGTVQLSGFARSQAEIDKAVALTRQVKGVRAVRNDIQLRTDH